MLLLGMDNRASLTENNFMKIYSRVLRLLLLAFGIFSSLSCDFSDCAPVDGTRVEYYENCQKEYEEHYKNGKQHGRETYWYQHGQRLLEVHWKDDKKDGLETWWDKDGTKIIEVQYKNSKEVSRTAF